MENYEKHQNNFKSDEYVTRKLKSLVEILLIKLKRYFI